MRTGAEAALAEFRRTRRRRYVEELDFMEVLYRVYVAAIAAAIGLGVLAGAINEAPASASALEQIRVHAPPLIGIAIGLGVLAGLRSGSRGGPLAIEPAEVQYTLLAPLDRGRALRPAALKQLRIAAIAGAVAGAVVGNFVFRRFPGSPVEWIAGLALFGALVPVCVLGAALLASGRRLRPLAAAAIGTVLVAWSVADLVFSATTSPATVLGELATLPLQHGAQVALAAAGAALALAVLGGGLVWVGGILLEAARRRASLAAELRFTASVGDLRTVILLRRQLAAERPRRRPWLLIGSAGAHPVWRRGWQSFMRWPAVRVARVLMLAVGAGAVSVAAWRASVVLFVVPGVLLFVAALDLIEPFAQEVDHPTLRLLLPRTSAVLWRRHLVAPAVGAAIVLVIAALAAAAVGGDPGLALGVGAVSLVPLALVLVCAAATSATNDPYEYVLIPQLNMAVNAAPIVISLFAVFLPLFIAWKVEGGDGTRVGAALVAVPVGVSFGLIGLGVLEWRANKREREAM
jgi:hypothetical protein